MGTVTVEEDTLCIYNTHTHEFIRMDDHVLRLKKFNDLNCWTYLTVVNKTEF